MATQQFGTNDAETVKLWSRILYTEAKKHLDFASLLGEGEENPIRLETRMNKDKGDRVRVTMTPQLIGLGRTEREVLEGNEETRATYTDDITVNELWHAVDRIPEGSIDNQRVIHNLRMEAKDALKDWWADRFSIAKFIHAAGYLGNSITVEGNTYSLTGTDAQKIYGFNSPLAATNLIRAGAHANDQSITSSDGFTLDLIEKAKVMAQLANPKISPIMVDGKKKYVMYLHPEQVYALRTDATASRITWMDLAKNVQSESRVYQGALGEYNGVILREHEHVAPGYHSTSLAQITTVRRAVLYGQSALCLAFGGGNGATRFTWREQFSDYERKSGIAAGAIWGMKKVQFNSRDWGCVVVSSYAKYN